jgi:hypothetical protein
VEVGGMAIILAQRIIVVTELGNWAIVLLLMQVIGASHMYIQQTQKDVPLIMKRDVPPIIIKLLVLWIA